MKSCFKSNHTQLFLTNTNTRKAKFGIPSYFTSHSPNNIKKVKAKKMLLFLASVTIYSNKWKT